MSSLRAIYQWNLALTVNTTFYDYLALFIDMYMLFLVVLCCFILYIFIYLPLAFLLVFFIVFVTTPLNRVTWSHGAI